MNFVLPPKTREWIRVDDRLPDNGEIVVARNSMPSFAHLELIVYWSNDDKCFICNERMSGVVNEWTPIRYTETTTGIESDHAPVVAFDTEGIGINKK